MSLTGRETEKMSSITHPQSRMVPGYCMVLRGIQAPPYSLDYSSLQGGSANEGDLAGHMGPCASLEEVQVPRGLETGHLDPWC